MFYNFVKIISYVKYGQCFMKQLYSGCPTVTDRLHYTAAFRPLLLFRLHDNSHQALTFFSASHLYPADVITFHSHKQSERHRKLRLDIVYD